MLVRLMPELARTRPGAPIVAERMPALRQVVYLGAGRRTGGMAWPEFLALGDSVAISDARGARSHAAVRRSDQHPVHVRHDGLSERRNAVASQHPQQRLLRRRDAALHRSRPHLPAGAVLSLLRLRAGQHGGAHARLPPIVMPGESFEPRSRCAPSRRDGCTSIYGVPTMFIAQLDHPRFAGFRLETLRTGIMAGAPCPIDVMRQVIDRMHVPEMTIGYGMTETSPVSFQSRGRRPDRPARVHGRPGAAARRVQDRRSGDRRDRAARDRGRAVHARLLGDARLLERPDGDGAGHRRGALDAQRRPRGDERRRVRHASPAASRT